LLGSFVHSLSLLIKQFFPRLLDFIYKYTTFVRLYRTFSMFSSEKNSASSLSTVLTGEYFTESKEELAKILKQRVSPVNQ
jgi:hypothetical protein